MPRTVRASQADYCYHVLNRGNGRSVVFHEDEDYQEFVDLIGECSERLPMSVLGYCLMPNHFHLVLRPEADGDLSRWMQWLLTSQVRRHHGRHGTSGHVWEGRFRAFACQEDGHLTTLLRYVERNPLCSRLVKEAESWPWSSLNLVGLRTRPSYFDLGPRPSRAEWRRRVNRPMTEAELTAIPHCIKRGSPFGDEAWTKKTVKDLGLESSVRPRGRPRKIVP